MRRILDHLTLSLLVVLMGVGSASCCRKVEDRSGFSPFVSSLLSGSPDELHRLASLSGTVSGSIAVIGSPAECAAVSSELATCDRFDNIDGSLRPDGLPDFAGERIVAVLDSANFPYRTPQGAPGTDFSLSETAVRNLLAVMDADVACKIVIVCSPLLAEYCSAEMVRFLAAVGADVPVIASGDPSYSYTEETFRTLRRRNAFTHAIAYPVLETYKTVRQDPTGNSISLMACRPAGDTLVLFKR
ncbi:MAG: hypothetical protein ACI399_01925 [Candidatus Cryptobacteroides sp.]